MDVGAPEVFFEQLAKELQHALAKDDTKRVDDILDLWWDAKTRATEYDAKMWGFDPERWMIEERDILTFRANRQLKKNRKH